MGDMSTCIPYLTHLTEDCSFTQVVFLFTDGHVAQEGGSLNIELAM